jgi:putative transposase
MKNVTTTPELSHSTTESNSHLFDDWFDPIESGIRDRVRGLIEEMIRGELDAALSRPRYGRGLRVLRIAALPQWFRAIGTVAGSAR